MISDEINFRAKNTTRNKSGHFRMIKWLIHQDTITTLKIYIPDNGALKYISQKVIEL